MTIREDVIVMLRELSQGKSFSKEEAIALAQSNPPSTAQAVRQVLKELSQSKAPTTSEQCKVLDIAWEVLGIHACMPSILSEASEDARTVFLRDELRHRPHKFSGSELRELNKCETDGSILMAVKQAQIAKVKNEAQKLLSNPAELGRDLQRMKEYVSSYDFNPMLNELLGKVAEEFGKGDGFDQAAMMKHMRTFFERLHEQVAMKLHAAKPETKDGTDLLKCQQVIDHLERKDVLTKKSQALARALYGILSEEGVHALESTREYVRLCRNMVAEYGLILFYELDRRLSEK